MLNTDLFPIRLGHAAADASTPPPAPKPRKRNLPRQQRGLTREGGIYESDDYMEPSQWFLRPPPSTGARRLHLAVLEDACHIIGKARDGRTANARRLYAETSGWVASNDRRWPFSFLRVCEALDLEPDEIRRGLARDGWTTGLGLRRGQAARRRGTVGRSNWRHTEGVSPDVASSPTSARYVA